jgi:hypothetical protein
LIPEISWKEKMRVEKWVLIFEQVVQNKIKEIRGCKLQKT